MWSCYCFRSFSFTMILTLLVFFWFCFRQARYSFEGISIFQIEYLETEKKNEMPVLTIERPRLAPEMRDALKRHIQRERQKKKEEADANEADKQRRRAEKVIRRRVFISFDHTIVFLGQSVIIIESATRRHSQRYLWTRTNSCWSRTTKVRTMQSFKTSLDRRRSTKTFTTNFFERTIMDQSISSK